MDPVLVTGVAGFVGLHVAERYLAAGRPVIGIDDLNDYYDVSLKRARLARLEGRPGFRFRQLDIADTEAMEALFAEHRFGLVVHLAAQAGVRHSLRNPRAYAHSNVDGFLNVLEGCRHHGCAHLVYASSSSVYGALTKMPFSVHDNVDHPVSLYAATKKANELFAHSYSHLYGLPTTGLRFFTVYGPWYRPDMALYLFTKAIVAGEAIDVFNQGLMLRDFTYIDDVVEGILRIAERTPTPNLDWDGTLPDPGTSTAPYRLYNVGNNRPVQLLRLIEVLEDCLGRRAIKRMLPMQPGDVPATCADVDDLAAAIGFAPSTPIEVGVERFVRWYRDYHAI